MMSVYFTESKIAAATPLEMGQTVTAHQKFSKIGWKIGRNKGSFLPLDSGASHTVEINKN